MNRKDKEIDETPEERKERLRKMNMNRKDKEIAETPEERKERQNKNALAMKEAYQKKLEALAEQNRARSYQQTEKDKESDSNEVKRRKGFQNAVYIGPIYVCSCCSQRLFRNSVTKVTKHLQEKIKEKNEEMTTCLMGYRSPDGNIYICSTCRDTLSAGRMPPMAVANGLAVTDLPAKYELTELENNMIAQNINFQKIILLPKSRWAAGKGRMVSVPVGVQDIMNTVKQVPRLPEEAGLIQIKLKRKKQYKGHEKSELIRPEKLFKVLQKLKEMEHPYYQCYDTQEEYQAREREREKRSNMQQMGDKVEDDIEEYINPLPEGGDQSELSDEVLGGENPDDIEDELAKDEADMENDPVRRQHFNYSQNSVLVNGYPEIMLDDEGNQVADLNFAPAEGKIPENFLDQKDWDIKSWPTLHPDGKFGMDFPRKVILTRQKYFNQRILGKNEKFAKTPGYVFGATSYVESQRLRSNANISGYRGKKETDEEGKVSYNMKNPFTVFDKVKNTPKYWQNVKFEMIAKMENMGPFHWFFTLSCGDKRWSANFHRYFEDNNFGLQVDEEGCVWVTESWERSRGTKKGWEEGTNENGERIMKILWDDLKDGDEFKKDVPAHEEIRNNVLLATRNFQHRVEMFKKEVIFGANNPMKVRHITYRVEFQGRGAGHIHGVLWVDLEEINKDMKKDIDKGKEEIMHELMGKKGENANSETVLVEAYNKLRKRKQLSKTETMALEKFADKFCTCSLDNDKVGKKVVKIVEKVNEHGHSKSCKKAPPKCRWKFPRFPLDKTTFIDVNREIPEGEELKPKFIDLTLERVKLVLVEDKNGKEVKSQKVEEIMKMYPKNKNTIRKRIEVILEEASKDGEGEITYETYRRAVEQHEPGKGCKLHLKRDIDEIFINNYNPEWLEAWDSNIDISLVSDFYGAITYITDYWTKDSSGLTDVLRTAVKQLNKDDKMKKKCHEMANTFISHRQIGEAEAYYKLFPHMNLVYSSVATIYIPTVSKGERRQFLKKQDPDTKKGFEVKDKTGLFLEKPDMVSKYERRKILEKKNVDDGEDLEEDDEDTNNAKEAVEQISYAQFAKMYKSSQNYEEYGKLATDDNYNFVMVGVNQDKDGNDEKGPEEKDLKLPEVIYLQDTLPGEASNLRRRSFPQAIRFYKQNKDADEHKFHLQELMMYLPFRSESELFPHDKEKCKHLYSTNLRKINMVKAKVMPFLVSVEDARSSYEKNREEEDPDLEEVAAMLDPEKEQEIIDGDEEEEEEHPEYIHLNTDQIEEESTEELKTKKVFRSIEIPSKQERIKEARKLDKMQRHVLSVGLTYAKGLVKARKRMSKIPTPPRMMVHGGAGSGKSSVIKPLAEWMQDILQQQGDDPDCPHVVLSSFTGAAAANINGQTLHSLFGFKFGTKFVSLSDQKRDETRCRFRNLKVVIVDEISLVSADLFYNFDLKLREIMQVSEPFGGLAIFLFGDLFQLRPPKGSYVFEEPKDREHSVVFQLRNLWQEFTVVILEENHRQGEDKIYADVLNRVRTGEFTEDDIELLKTRVKEKDDLEVKRQDEALHIYGTNMKVNSRNKKKVNEIEGELLEVKAENRHRMIRNFKPKVDAAGCVLNTPFQAVLQLKRGAQVIMTKNIDTVDGLTNGARGVLLDVEKVKEKNGQTTLKRLIVKFHNPKHGQDERERHPCKKYPQGTYVQPIWWQYNLGGSTAEVYQFPVKMAAAITAHKIQVNFIQQLFSS